MGTFEEEKGNIPEVKKEREELEAAYDLYCEVCKMNDWTVFSSDIFNTNVYSNQRNTLLAIVRLRYRKGE